MKELSIVIPLHNMENSILKALSSIAMQSISERIEVIIADDASTDCGLNEVQKWAKKSNISVQWVRHTHHQGTMKTRLLGYAATTASYIMFMDADDTLVGKKNLESALLLMKQSQVDILHCRTQGLSPDGTVKLGEMTWAAPLMKKLVNPELFSTFFLEKTYPPLQIWSKIFSRSLMNIVAKKAKDYHINRFDDKFLVSLAISYAHSYLGSDEIIYEYKTCDTWTVEKYAGRIKDLYTILDVITPLLETMGSDKNILIFHDYIKRRITFNTGKLCIEAEKYFNTSTANTNDFFKNISKFIEDKLFIQSILLSTTYNNIKINKIIPMEYCYPNHNPNNMEGYTIKFLQNKYLQFKNQNDLNLKLIISLLCIRLKKIFDKSAYLPQSMLDDFYEQARSKEFCVFLIRHNATTARKLQKITHVIFDLDRVTN